MKRLPLYFPPAQGESRILLVPGGWRRVRYCSRCGKPLISERTERRWKRGRVVLGRCVCFVRALDRAAKRGPRP